MIFNNHFLLLNHIILNYSNINYDLILNHKQLKKELFITTDSYIYWHAKNIGTNLTNYKMLQGLIPIINIKQKPLKYYINILIKNDDDYLPYAFYDIFFNKCKICILISGFMRNYKLNLLPFQNLFNNYQIDYYVCTYDIIGIGDNTSENYSKEKFNIEELNEIIPIKKYIIKEYNKCEKISDDIKVNKSYYQSINIFDCYNLIDENYFFYIRFRPDLNFVNLDEIINEYFDEIINNKLIMHSKYNNLSESNNDWILNMNYPHDYITISNILTSQIYYKFHLNIYKYDESYEKTLYNYLKEKNVEIIAINLCSINRSRPFVLIKRDIILRIGKR
jgi:hypothetical protein